ncbi:hypothetical protein GGF31_007625 [Allomyces arbusculus]|nr:hypothetical protein GGF31_007625 [Allomyces arbusculus]
MMPATRPHSRRWDAIGETKPVAANVAAAAAATAADLRPLVHLADGLALGATQPATAPVVATTALMQPLTPTTPVSSSSSVAASSAGPAPAPHPPPSAPAPAALASAPITRAMGPTNPTPATASRSPRTSSTAAIADQPPLLPSLPSSWLIIVAPLWSVPAIAVLAPMQLVVHVRGFLDHHHPDHHAAAAGPRFLRLHPSLIRLIKAADTAHAASTDPAVMLAIPQYAAQRYVAVKSLQQINTSIENFRYSPPTVMRAVCLIDAYTQRVFTGHAPASAAAAAAAAKATADHPTRPLLAAPQWRLLTVACLSLAAVIEEEYDDPLVADLAPIVELDQYTAASVREAKRSVAVTLEYQLSRPTAMDALYELLRTPGLDAYLAPFLQPIVGPLLLTTELAIGSQDEQQQGLLPQRWLSPLIGIAQHYLIAALGDASLLGAHPVVLAAATINVALNVIAHLAHSETTLEPAPGATSGSIARYHLFRELAIDVSSPAMATTGHTVAFCAARMNELFPRIEFLEGELHGLARSRSGLVSPPPTPTVGAPAGHTSWPAADITTVP